jgi:hypothetical protein
MLARSNPEAARELLQMAQDDVARQWRVYANRAAMAGVGIPSSQSATQAEIALGKAPKGGKQ